MCKIEVQAVFGQLVLVVGQDGQVEKNAMV